MFFYSTAGYPQHFCQVAPPLDWCLFLHLGGERHLWEESVLPKNTTQWPWQGHEPGLLDPYSSVLSLHTGIYQWFIPFDSLDIRGSLVAKRSQVFGKAVIDRYASEGNIHFLLPLFTAGDLPNGSIFYACFVLHLLQNLNTWLWCPQL